MFLKNIVVIAAALLGVGEAYKGAPILDNRNDAVRALLLLPPTFIEVASLTFMMNRGPTI